MKLDIAARLHPYSHRPGTSVVLPGSSLRAQFFPTRIVVEGMAKQRVLEIPVTGPVEEFTVQQDLERGEVAVWGRAREGFFRLHMRASHQAPEGFLVAAEKMPEGCVVAWEHMERLGPVETDRKGLARLSLGSHKAQDWELLHRREDFAELLPIWHRLGQMVPQGTCEVFADCAAALERRDAVGVMKGLRAVFLASFDGIFAPRFEDTLYQGIALPRVPEGVVRSPLSLLSHGSELIGTLFVQVSSDVVELLPVLPPQFHAGRFVGVSCGWGKISVEWTKKAVRRAVLEADRDTTVSIQGRSQQKSCRIRTSTKDRGVRYLLGTPLSLLAGTTYWLDNFEK